MSFFEKVLKIQKKNLTYKITELDKFLALRDKNLVFIGTIGVGKTTSICSLLNLFDENNRPILKTGAGATTICEVEIVFGREFHIKIDEYTTDEMKQLIYDFTDTKLGNTQNVDGQQQRLSTEMERAIKYVIAPHGMRLIDIDQYLREIINNNNLQRQTIIDIFLGNADLHSRTITEFYCELNPEDPMLWVRETFSDLNDGKNKLANIPKKIYITLKQDKENNNKIIDTKGIDSSEKDFLREDFDRYIKNPDNLIIYCSSFTAAPDYNIFESIKFYLKKDIDLSKRMILLIIPRHDEPNHVSGVVSNYEIDDYKQGIDLRLRAVQAQLLNELNVSILTLNHNFRAGQNGINNNSFNDIISRQNEIINECIIEKNNLTLQFNNLQNNILTTQQILIQNDIINNLNNLKSDFISIKFNTTNFISDYVNRYTYKYSAANTKNAIHVRYGIFSTKNLYFDFEILIEQIINEHKLNNNFLSKLQRCLGINPQIIHDIVPTIYEDFDNRFRELTLELTEEMRSYFSNKATNYDFWQPLIRRWGGGPGYNNDVKSYLQIQMHNISVDSIFEKTFYEKWNPLVESFINDLK